jgi:Secretion system C-terminal sorting domain
MKTLVALIFIFLFSDVVGQYTYFNKSFGPPHNTSSFMGSSQLVTRGDSSIISGIYPNGTEYESYYLYLDQLGDSIYSIEKNEGLIWHYTGVRQALTPIDDGYYFTTGEFGSGVVPVISHFDRNFDEIWRYSIPELATDSTTSSFACLTILEDGNLLGVGVQTVDPDPNSVSDEYTHTIMAKLTPLGSPIWMRNFDLSQEAFASGFERNVVFLNSAVTELSNHDYLLWGVLSTSAYHPAVARFDSEGNFISAKILDLGLENDANPIPFPIGNDQFVFGISHHISNSDFGEIRAPRWGKFDATTMTNTWYPYFDHQYRYLTVDNIIKRPNGNYCFLGSAYDGVTMGFSYLLECDELGNEMWWNRYFPPIAYNTPMSYDLDNTPDGGIVFMGQFYQDNAPPRTWVVKTDACGDTQNLGCPLGVEEMDKNSPVTLYPNPTSDVLHVALADQNFSEVSLCNLLGETLQTHNLRGLQNTTFNTTNLSPGVYVVKLKKSSGEMEVMTFVRE